MALPDIRSMMQGRRPGAGPKTAPPSAQAMVPALEAPGGIQSFRIAANAQESPESITARRERWGGAVEGPLDVYTPSPLLAGAKALTMGLGGYQQSKADKDMDAGRQGYQQKLAQMLETGKMDPSIMGDAFATPEGTRMAQTMWERENPAPMTPQQQLQMKIDEFNYVQAQKEAGWKEADRNKPNWATINGPDGDILRYDQNDPNSVPTPFYDAPPKPPPGWEVKGDGKTGYYTYDPRDPEGTWTAMPGSEGSPPAVEDADFGVKVGKDLAGSPGFQRYQSVAPTLNSMYQSINDPTAMADLDFVYGLAKILDPTSVVRESEAGMVIDAQGIAPSMLGQLNKFISGGQAMSPKIRADLFSVAQRRAEELRQQAEQERGHFSGVLEQSQLDPETYLQDPTPTPKWSDQNMGEASGYRPPAPPATSQEPPVVMPYETPASQPAPAPQPAPQQQDDAALERMQGAPAGIPPRLWSTLEQDEEYAPKIQKLMELKQQGLVTDEQIRAALQQDFPDFFTPGRGGQ